MNIKARISGRLKDSMFSKLLDLGDNLKYLMKAKYKKLNG